MMSTGGQPRTWAGRVAQVALATAVAAVLAVSMSGCFANPMDKLMDKVVEQGAGNIVKKVTGGNLDVGSVGEMPKDFPAEVPLASNDVIMSFSMKTDDGKAWTVGVRTDGSLDEVAERVKAAFAQKGWEESTWSNIGEEMSGGLFTLEAADANAVVSIMVDDDSGKVMVNYVVNKGSE